MQWKTQVILNYNIFLNVANASTNTAALNQALQYAVVPQVQIGTEFSGYQSWDEIKAATGAQVAAVPLGYTKAAEYGALQGKAKDYFALAVHMDEKAGNAYQGQALTIDVTVEAKQMASESDSFGSQYDANAKYSYITIGATGETVFSAGDYSAIGGTAGKYKYYKNDGYASFQKEGAVEYKIYIPEDGNYMINTYSSNPNTAADAVATLSVLIDGVESGSGTVAPVGKQTDFDVAYDLGTYQLKKGFHTLGFANNSRAVNTAAFSVISAKGLVFIAPEGETKFYAGEYSAITGKFKWWNGANDKYAEFRKDSSAEYNVFISKDGFYAVNTYSGSKSAVSLEVWIDGVKNGEGDVYLNDNFLDFSTASELGAYYLTKGIHTIKIENKVASLNTRYFSLTPASGVITIQEEGETKISINRNQKNIILDTNITEYYGNLAVIRKTQYVEYKIGVTKSGSYKISTYASHVANADVDFTVSVDGTELGAGTVPAGDAWEDFSTPHKLGVYNLTSCVHTFRVENKVGTGVYINAFTFEPVEEDTNVNQDAFDYESLDKANAVYKNIYVATDGSDDAAGSAEAPFKTIERALQEVASGNAAMTGDIVVNIAPGSYELADTLALTDAHSGKNGFNVIIKGTDANNESVISGGTKVEGWTKHNDNLWKATLTEVSEVRNLYVNDYPAIRARSKYKYTYEENYVKDGSSNTSDGVLVGSRNFLTFAHPEDLETIWEGSWRHYRIPVDTIEYNVAGHEGYAAIVMKQPAWTKCVTGQNGAKKSDTFYMENAMELLDEPGEFYFDSRNDVIYYYPYDGEDMATAETYVGRVETLITVNGTSKDSKASNLIFDNLSFKYGAWDLVSEEGMVNLQADCTINFDPASNNDYKPGGLNMQSPGQFYVQNAENLTVKNCLFACLGSSALQFYDAVEGVKVEGNVIRDVSGAGIMIGTWLHITSNGSMDAINGETCDHFMVRNNVIRRVANEYFGQTAISVYYESNINIVHNDIQDLPYTAISAGWGWGYASMMSTYHKNINITHNKISNAMQVLNDGAQIYTLGNLNGSTIAYNYVTDSSNVAAGIYLDEGSSNIAVHDNVSRNNSRWLYLHLLKDGETNNKIYNNFSIADHNDRLTSGAIGNTTVEEAIVVSESNITTEAQKIIDEAGVEEEYSSLLSDAAFPSGKDERISTLPDSIFISQDKYAPKYGWIQAEDFRPGDNGVAYYDDTNDLNNNNYRPEAVDLLYYDKSLLENSTKVEGYIIHNSNPGEWVTYNVRIPGDGEYEFKLRYAHGYADGSKFNLYIGDELELEDYVIEKGEQGWYDVVDKSCGTFTMTKGDYVIKFEFKGNGFYVDALGFFGDAEDTGVDTSQPSFDYDEGKIV